jgi:hypothetical protein
MDFTKDEWMLLILYGKDTLSDTIVSMQKVKKKLQPDETELDRMLNGIIRKLQGMTEAEFAKLG